ncbi:MAG: hypothetical protein A2520_05520 [Deltaproteobacteria bacterium RIFOXYD12_FULL_53_23]|nr:MAG: hypothetical protein A2520_05520 [Deltaproteobacteria bacterium RIFOXYD12_FULL_53_23]
MFIIKKSIPAILGNKKIKQRNQLGFRIKQGIKSIPIFVWLMGTLKNQTSVAPAKAEAQQNQRTGCPPSRA